MFDSSEMALKGGLQNKMLPHPKSNKLKLFKPHENWKQHTFDKRSNMFKT